MLIGLKVIGIKINSFRIRSYFVIDLLGFKNLGGVNRTFLFITFPFLKMC